MEGAVRPGALRVRDALNMACKKQQQGGAQAGAVSQAPCIEEEGACYPG